MTQMKKTEVRLSFNVPASEHVVIKTECVQSRIAMKDFLHELILLGLNQYQKLKLKEDLKKSIKQAKAGKSRILSVEELDEMEKSLNND